MEGRDEVAVEDQPVLGQIQGLVPLMRPVRLGHFWMAGLLDGVLWGASRQRPG